MSRIINSFCKNAHFINRARVNSKKSNTPEKITEKYEKRTLLDVSSETCFVIKSSVIPAENTSNKRSARNESALLLLSIFSMLQSITTERKEAQIDLRFTILLLSRCPRIADGRCNRDIRRLHLIVPRRKRWRKKISAQPRNIRPSEY